MTTSPTIEPRPAGETAGSSQRDSRQLTGLSLSFDLAEELASLKREDSWLNGDRNSRSLVMEPQLRIVLIVMKAGAQMREHSTEGLASVHCLSGHIRMGLPTGSIVLRAGHIAALEAGVRHDLEGLEESVLLLTIASPVEAGSPA